jgi:hypothetical protein
MEDSLTDIFVSLLCGLFLCLLINQLSKNGEYIIINKKSLTFATTNTR